jgi:hypothetical protein
MLKDPAFHERYQWIRVQGSIGNRATGQIWVKRERSAIGVVRGSERIDIPGYLFSGQAADAVARLDARNRLVTETTAREPGVLPALTLPAGRYRIELVPAGPNWITGLRCGGISAERVAPGEALVLELERQSEVSLALAPSAGRLGIERAILLKSTLPPTHRCGRPRARLRVAREDLTRRQPENAFWAHPQNVLFGSEGLSVAFAPMPVRHLELSVDNNDTYEVNCLAGGDSAFRRRVEPRKNGGGLAVHRWDLPEPTTIDEVVVTAREGDRSYSLGHLVLGP